MYLADLEVHPARAGAAVPRAKEIFGATDEDYRRVGPGGAVDISVSASDPEGEGGGAEGEGSFRLVVIRRARGI